MKIRFLVSMSIMLFVCFAMVAQVRLVVLCNDEDGVPYSDATVLLELLDDSAKPKQSSKSGITNEEGQAFFNVQGGHYRIVASTPYSFFSIKHEVLKDEVVPILIRRVSELDDVLIRSVRLGKKDDPSTSIMSKKDVEKLNNGRDMPYLFRQLNNVITSSDAGTGVGYTGMRVRGGDQTTVNVTLNGVPLNDSESHNVFWVDLPDLASSVKDVWLTKGISSSAHGSGSFGASVHVKTNDWSQTAKAKISGGIGSFGYKKAGLSFHSGELKKGLFLNGRYSVLKSDGYIDRASADLSSLHLSLAYLSNKQSLRISILKGDERTYQAWFGISDEQLAINRKFNPAGTERLDAPYQDQVDDYGQDHFQIQYTRQFRNTSVSLTGHYTKGKGFFEEYRANENVNDYGIDSLRFEGVNITNSDLVRRRWLDNDFFGIILSTETNMNSKMTLNNGFTLNRYLGTHFGEVIWMENNAGLQNDFIYYDNDAVKTEIAAYSKLSYNSTNQLSAILDFQIRHIDYTYEGQIDENNRGALNDKLLFFNPKLFVTKSLNKQTRLFFKTGLSNREPNRDDYVDAAAFIKPKSEQIWDTELGVKRVWKGGLQIDLNLYYMHYNDQLVNVGTINDVGAYIRTNVDKSYRAGLELNAVYNLDNKLNLHSGLSFNESAIIDFSEFIDSYDEAFNWLGQKEVKHTNKRLPFSPQVVSFVGVDYTIFKNKNMSIVPNIQFKYVGDQYLDLGNQNQTKLTAYQTIDAGLRLAHSIAGKSISISAQVINVLNEKYVSNGWSYKYLVGNEMNFSKGNYPQAGRHFLLNVSMTL